MSSPVVGPLRVARAALVATLVLALSALAHRVGGGALPDPLVLAALAAFTFAGTTAVARARFTVPRLVLVLGGAQLALHTAFRTLGHGVASCVTAPVPAGHGGHASLAVCDGPLAPLGDGAAAAHSHLLTGAAGGAGTVASADNVMLAAHVVATAVLAVVLARGERALERFLAWARSCPTTAGPVALVPAVRQTVLLVRQVPVLAVRVVGVAPTRGPPLQGVLVGNSA
ncbi:hypothetical protein IF650_05835 [Cellulosimicrobium terreum]|nr:hypothetical protein [Cellulosimicrobium terreum]